MMKRLTKKEINLMIEIACYYRKKRLSPNNYPFWMVSKKIKNLIKKGYINPNRSNSSLNKFNMTVNTWDLTDKGKLIVKLLLSTNTLEKLKEKIDD